MAIAEEGEFKGNAVLTLKQTEDDFRPFSFGLKKAKLILEHIADIEKFVEKHEPQQPEPDVPPPEEE